MYATVITKVIEYLLWWITLYLNFLGSTRTIPWNCFIWVASRGIASWRSPHVMYIRNFGIVFTRDPLIGRSSSNNSAIPTCFGCPWSIGIAIRINRPELDFYWNPWSSRSNLVMRFTKIASIPSLVLNSVPEALSHLPHSIIWSAFSAPFASTSTIFRIDIVPR